MQQLIRSGRLTNARVELVLRAGSRPPWHTAQRSNQSGAAMIVVMILAMLTFAAGMTAARGAKTELRIAHNNQLNTQALAAAEAGLLHGYRLIKNSFTGSFDAELSDGVSGSLTTLGTDVDLDSKGIHYREATLGSSTYYVRLLDNIDESTNNPALDADNHVIIEAKGRSATAERTVQAWIQSSTKFGMFGKTLVRLDMTGDIDSYDSTVGPYATGGSEANIGSNVNVHTNKASIVVNGSVTSGGTVTGLGTVTGQIKTNAAPVSFDTVAACGPGYSDTTGMSGNYNYSGTASGNLTLNGNKTLTLASGTYCFNEVSISGNAKIALAASASVEIFLTGAANITGSGLVNPSSQPKDLKIYSSHSDFYLWGSTDTYATIYAPDTQIDIGGSADFYGMIIGDIINVDGSVNIHLDDSQSVGGELSLLSWHEVRD